MEFCTMKVVELVNISTEALKLMSKHDVLRDDWRFVPMYEQYQHMRSLGIKYRACIKELSHDFKVSKATIERALRRLSRNC